MHWQVLINLYEKLFFGEFQLWGSLPIICTSADVLNDIYSRSYFSVSLMIYVATYLVGVERGGTPMWKVLYVGINPRGNCSYLIEPTSSFSSLCQLVALKYLGNGY